ncbi:MAG: hypothetical protein QXL94_05920 [Candidatus Parvarchaeum sp.]
MVINTNETATLNAQGFSPFIVPLSLAINTSFSTTYIIESTGKVFIEVFGGGSGASLEVTAVSSFNSSFSPSTTTATKSFVGAAGSAMAFFLGDYPIDAVLTIKVTAGGTTALDGVFTLRELQSGISK